jgi:hypothetical protein
MVKLYLSNYLATENGASFILLGSENTRRWRCDGFVVRRCRKSGGESVLASFPRSDYASNSTNIGWLSRTGHIIGVALLHVSRVVRPAEFPPAAKQRVHVFKVRSSRSFSWIEAMHTLRRFFVLQAPTRASPNQAVE